MVDKGTQIGTLVRFKRGFTIVEYAGDGFSDFTFSGKQVICVSGSLDHKEQDDCWCRGDFVPYYETPWEIK